MESAKTVGRVMGLLLIVQAIIGSTVNFGLLGSTVMGPPGFLTNAAQYPNRMSIAALLLIVAGFISIAISTTVFPVFRRYSLRGAIAYVVLTGAGLALVAVEASAIMSMLTISQQYTAAGGADSRYYEIVGTAVRYARYWAHYPNLIVGSGTLLLVYSILFRFNLVLRLLTGIGMAAILLQLVGLSMPFFGYRVNFYLLTPMGICHIILASWLVARGFRELESEEAMSNSEPIAQSV
jgi:hypothetical protein